MNEELDDTDGDDELPSVRLILPDDPLWSPLRVAEAVWKWAWWIVREPAVYVPLRIMLRYHDRPNASHRDGVY